ncbi:hypothetical protein B6178_04380 [Staphylococcus aureus]|nr:hypothetical protein BSG38_04325 [Staphylococcus aureus]APZ41580.1 hypothetical protein BSG37_04195 [Staphylococcus aureus]AVT25502.1 hypothetical protein B6175_04350 [Staphylococcus aureus]AVU18002.1 hypothetical protein B6178_04380 [Staphylococcus aureus]OLF23948.1 hypothetical protein BSZ09_12975 [Staphylococcus aureus]
MIFSQNLFRRLTPTSTLL